MRKEDGFTLIEVLIAAMILVMGSFAAFGMLRAATLNTQRAKATQVALNRAQQELEVLRGIPDEQLALTATPQPSTNPKSPGYRVNSAAGTFALSRSPLGNYGTLVENGDKLYGTNTEISTGIVSPGPTSFTSGSVSGRIYRYIVWRNDTSCPEATCPGPEDYKQVVVAVRIDKAANQASEQGYVEVQSTFINPKDNAKNDPIPGGNGVTTAQQFFLSDSRCSSSGAAVRGEVTESHTLHNTLGTCASTDGTTPDALVLGAPPDPSPEDPTQPLEYDYSTDYPLGVVTAAAKGIQLRRDDSSGCHNVPTGTAVPQWQVHRWVTDPMTSELQMSERVTLVIKTRAINETGYTGALCIYLFDRTENGTEYKDAYLLNKQTGTAGWRWSPSASQWPREWFEIQVPMLFNGPYPLKVGHRLGLALSVDGKTGADAVSLMYDHPSFRARIEVETPTPIGG